MTQAEIVRALTRMVSDPSEVVFAVTMQDLIIAIALRLREDALLLTLEELLLARDEARETFEHYLDEREILVLALDQWDVVRQL